MNNFYSCLIRVAKTTLLKCRIPEWSEAVLKTVGQKWLEGSIPLYGVQVHEWRTYPFCVFSGCRSDKNTKSYSGVMSISARRRVRNLPVGKVVVETIKWLSNHFMEIWCNGYHNRLLICPA